MALPGCDLRSQPERRSFEAFTVFITIEFSFLDRFRKLFSSSKITNFDNSICRSQNIRTLDISVHNLLWMDIRDPFQYLIKIDSSNLFIKRSKPLNHSLKATPRDQLKYNIKSLRIWIEVPSSLNQLHNVRMIQLLQNQHLRPHLIQLLQSSLLVFHLLRGHVDCLDRYSFPVAVIHALVNFSVRALPDDLASDPFVWVVICGLTWLLPLSGLPMLDYLDTDFQAMEDL